MYPSVHLECNGTAVGSMELRPDNEVQATHVGTMDLTHKSRDHDLPQQMQPNSLLQIMLGYISKFLNTADL